MEILFRQRESEHSENRSALEHLGIERCMLKRIFFERDGARITRKRHYHAGVEIHIIDAGYQTYEIDGQILRVEAGQYLLIPPLVKHVVLEEDPHTLKYAITFHTKENSPFAIFTDQLNSCFVGNTHSSVRESILCIQAEGSARKAFYASVVCGRVMECILHLYRLMGIRDTGIGDSFDAEENDRFLLAKQYVEDNICQRISVPELASYCYISEKQLERIFERESGLTVMEYVRKRKCIQIEKMLFDPSLSLRHISEIMNFNNEYHFNSFFKKYAGMTPGAYRKSVLKK